MAPRLLTCLPHTERFQFPDNYVLTFLPAAALGCQTRRFPTVSQRKMRRWVKVYRPGVRTKAAAHCGGAKKSIHAGPTSKRAGIAAQVVTESRGSGREATATRSRRCLVMLCVIINHTLLILPPSSRAWNFQKQGLANFQFQFQQLLRFPGFPELVPPTKWSPNNNGRQHFNPLFHPYVIIISFLPLFLSYSTF